MSRDFSKALENIRKAMRDQDEEFRREEGLAPKQPKLPDLNPKPQPSQEISAGELDPNRFLNKSIGQEPVHEPTPQIQSQTQDTAPEIVEVLPQKDSRHSWLYNEVAKAIHNASGNNQNIKVVAVFVPVVQSGHEFEDMPVHETVNLPPVNEDDFRIKDEIDFQEDPVTTDELPHDSEVQELLAEETSQPEAQELLAEETSQPEAQELLTEETSQPEVQELFSEEPTQPEEQELFSEEPTQPEVQELFSEETSQPEVQELFSEETSQPEAQGLLTEEPTQPEVQEQQDLPEELAAEPEQADHLGELIPESMDHPDPELAEAFNTMEEILDEHIAAANEELPELELPDELEDDEIIDDIDESSEDSKAN